MDIKAIAKPFLSIDENDYTVMYYSYLEQFAQAVIAEFVKEQKQVAGVVIRDNSVTLLMNSHILHSDIPLFTLEVKP